MGVDMISQLVGLMRGGESVALSLSLHCIDNPRRLHGSDKGAPMQDKMGQTMPQQMIQVLDGKK